MEELNADTIRQVLADPDPVLETLSLLLKEVATESVAAVVAILEYLGTDASQLPAEYLVQAVLVEADKEFTPITRESWIKVYDSYHQVKAIIDANPDLKAQINKTYEQANNTAESVLDGNF